jgi:DNA topoisomerase-1
MFDPELSASQAGLKYVTDSEPGIHRKKRGKGFIYVDEKARRVKSQKILQRIKDLVIPPAWRDVWICKITNGHLQVTGRDARNRKQYRYHEKWTVRRNDTKFDRLAALGRKIPKLRTRIENDLKLAGLPKKKVLAALVKVMLLTQCRVGNSTYAEENESYGLTTILDDHADIKGSHVHLFFKGKSGVEHDIEFSDPVLAKILDKCRDLPGEELFAYKNESGDAVDVTSTMVNDYLREITGEDFTAKDLRTWGGTCKAVEVLVSGGQVMELSDRQWAKRQLEVIRSTASFLRNTVSVCRKYYIHPCVFNADKEGHLHKLWKNCRKGKSLSREEKLLQLLLQRS